MLGISNTTTTAEATLVLTYTRNRLEQGCSRGGACFGLRAQGFGLGASGPCVQRMLSFWWHTGMCQNFSPFFGLATLLQVQGMSSTLL